jgi:orotidine-5'-phosphate decarboxylase
MMFRDKLDRAVDRNDSLLCIGLDPDRAKLPRHMGQFAYNKEIIDATADLVCLFKPNPAFYEALGVEGVVALKQTCDYIRRHYPQIPVLVDAKRGDIGNTNRGYAEYIFDYLGADATTVAPYMGGESLDVFLDYRDKGIFVLCRTSNDGAGEFQDLKSEGQTLYLHVANRVATHWNRHGNCFLVVGAPYPDDLRQVRALIGPDMPFLVPGVGAQGGDLAAAMAAGLGSRRRGLIINASRAIMFAGSGHDFAHTARQAALKLRDEINQQRIRV